MPKAMSQDGEEGRCVKHENNTDMRAAGAEGLLAGTLGRELKDSVEDEGVGNSNKDHIGDDSHERHSKSIPDVDGDVSRGKASNPYMFTVCVWDDTCPTKR